MRECIQSSFALFVRLFLLPSGLQCKINHTRNEVKILYSGFETCFAPSTDRDIREQTHISNSDFGAILKKEERCHNLYFTGLHEGLDALLQIVHLLLKPQS